MPSWDPCQYLKFDEERTRASRDLCARILLDAPERVLDLGCGPGNSTQILRERWPQAALTGLDSSPEMLVRARAQGPAADWLLADVAAWEPEAPFDVVFSNAMVQWLPDAEVQVPRFQGWAAPGGCLAVQVPCGNRMRDLIVDVAASPRWRAALAGAAHWRALHDPAFYYDLLAPRAARVDLWQTTYQHVLESHEALVEWYAGTGMRPFLDALPDPADRAAFRAEVLQASRGAYPRAADGKVLLAFPRLFFVAWNR
jgi:trans-aconitate 2-methyltransferase